MVFVPGPVLLIGLQVLDAWFFAVVAGVGLTLFQQIIPPLIAIGVAARITKREMRSTETAFKGRNQRHA